MRGGSGSGSGHPSGPGSDPPAAETSCANWDVQCVPRKGTGRVTRLPTESSVPGGVPRRCQRAAPR